jgi:probable phosphoglycerate mutase
VSPPILANAFSPILMKPDDYECMTYLFLIRHGENEWVTTHRLAGRTPGVHLNDKGREQAQFLAERLSNQPISAVYSSPLERCIETARPLAGKLGLPVLAEEGVLEVDYGEWQGGDLKELSKQPEWQLVQVFPSGFRFPGGETLREVQSRVIATLERLRRLHEGEAIAVFAHGDVVRTALAHYLGVPLDLFQRLSISTASVSIIGFHRFGPQILRINDTGDIPEIKLKKDSEEDAAQEPSPPNAEKTLAMQDGKRADDMVQD